jgi:hypothetical protein
LPLYKLPPFLSLLYQLPLFLLPLFQIQLQLLPLFLFPSNLFPLVPHHIFHEFSLTENSRSWGIVATSMRQV